MPFLPHLLSACHPLILSPPSSLFPSSSPIHLPPSPPLWTVVGLRCQRWLGQSTDNAMPAPPSSVAHLAACTGAAGKFTFSCQSWTNNYDCAMQPHHIQEIRQAKWTVIWNGCFQAWGNHWNLGFIIFIQLLCSKWEISGSLSPTVMKLTWEQIWSRPTFPIIQ